METKQLNLKISSNLLKAAEGYVNQYGYRNIQELISESMREKIFKKNEFDESFSKKEIGLLDSLIESSFGEKLVSEKDLNKVLLE